MAVRIPTDLLTPLGAYLRLREGAAASFLLESVEQGRLGRHSFIGSGTRLVSFEEAEALDEPVVGYLAYDHVAKLEPTVPLPADGPGPAGEPLRRRRDARPLRPRQRHGGGAGGRRGRDRRQARKGACVSETQSPLGALNHAADARPGHVRKGRGADPRAHPRRRRVPGRALAAGGAADLRLGARALPGAAPRQPLAVPLPARARRPRARRLLAGDARQVRGRPREPEPDRRHDASRRGRRRAAARLGEGPRRARDARRPRPQRPLPRLRARERPRRALPRAGALLARHAPRLGGDGRPARRRDAVRPPPRLLSGRHRLRRAEGARDADRLRARGLPPRPVRRRRRLRPPGRTIAWTRASRSGRSCSTDGVARLQAGAGIVADSDPAAEHRSACRSSPRSRPRSTSPRKAPDDAPDARQLRHVHLQPRPPLRGARRRGARLPERRDHGRRGRGARADAPRRLPRPRPAGGRRRLGRADPAARPDRADARRLPRPPGDRRGVRRRDRPGEGAPARQVVAGRARRQGRLRRPAGDDRGRPLPLARGAHRPGRARGDRPHARTAR